MQILRKELGGLVTGPVIAAQGACSFMFLSMRKGVLSEHHTALSLAHSHRGGLARCMCVGPSQRESIRALAEYTPKGGLGLRCPTAGVPHRWDSGSPTFSLLSWMPRPSFPYPLPQSSCSLFLPPLCACYLLMVCHDPSILSNLPLPVTSCSALPRSDSHEKESGGTVNFLCEAIVMGLSQPVDGLRAVAKHLKPKWR